MRAFALCAVLCACGGRQPPGLLFDRVPASHLDTVQKISVDFTAFDTDEFRIGLGQQTLVPKQLVRQQLVNGAVVQATFAGGGSLLLARVGATMTGVIRLGSKGGFEIQPVPGGHRLIPRSWRIRRPLHDNWVAVASKKGTKPAQKPPSNERVEITVQFAYTQKVLDQRTLEGIRGHITAAMKQLETACKETKVNVRFVATKEPVKTSSSEGRRTMYQLWDVLYQHKDFIDAHEERERQHADILVLLVDNAQGALGLGTIMGTPTTAVAVVDHHDSLWGLTIPHEIGHIMGGIHEDDDSNDPFKWGHGYVGVGGRTIMSNPCDDATRCILLERWSSLEAYGDEDEHDVARVLREIAPTVATFGDQL